MIWHPAPYATQRPHFRIDVSPAYPGLERVTTPRGSWIRIRKRRPRLTLLAALLALACGSDFESASVALATDAGADTADASSAPDWATFPPCKPSTAAEDCAPLLGGYPGVCYVPPWATTPDGVCTFTCEQNYGTDRYCETELGSECAAYNLKTVCVPP